MRILYYPALLLALLLTQWSCRDQSLINDPAVVHLDPEFSLDLYEQRDPADGHPTFGLWVETLADCSCSGCAVVAESRVQGTAIAVELMGVQAPQPCSGPPAAARTFIPIGTLAEGEYTILISLRSVVSSSGTLRVEKGRYTLTMTDPQGFMVRNYLLQSMPADLVWGYALSPDEPSVLLAQQWLSDLKKISSSPNLSPGFYGYFTVSGNGATFFHTSMEPGAVAQMFVRRLDAPLPLLRNTVEAYRAQSLSVRCLSTWGEL